MSATPAAPEVELLSVQSSKARGAAVRGGRTWVATATFSQQNVHLHLVFLKHSVTDFSQHALLPLQDY